jgi:hypothetical protein
MDGDDGTLVEAIVEVASRANRQFVAKQLNELFDGR